MESELSILNKLKDFRNTTDEVALRKFSVYSNLFEKTISNIKETLEQL